MIDHVNRGDNVASPYLDALSPDARRALVDTLLIRQSGRCFICEEPVELSGHPDAVALDVVQPLAAGGADEPSNCAVMHAGCSRSRQHPDLEVARALALFGRIRQTPADVWRETPTDSGGRSPAPIPPPAAADRGPAAVTPAEDHREGHVSAEPGIAVPTARSAPQEPAGAPPPAPASAPVRVVRQPAAPHGAAAAAAPPGSFGRALAFTTLGAAVPGVGFLAAGRRRLGLAVLGLAAALVVAAAVFILVADPTGTAVEVASRPGLLLLLGVGVLVVAALWIAVIIAGHRMVLPRAATRSQRWAAAGLAAALSLAVLLPALVVARYAFATKELIDTVFEATPASGDTPLTSGPIDRDDPWKETPRLNVLLLAGDSERALVGGSGGGFLTTTMIIASIDTATGDSRMVSLPDELQNAPFPADNPLAARYPQGYTCTPDPTACLLNGVYREARANADLFPGVPDPGLATVRDVVSEITGVPLDFHLFVDLEGFASLVDAVGGVEVDVGPEPVPVTGLGGLSVSSGSTAVQSIPPGRQRLDGREAVAFARERPGATTPAAAEERVTRQSAVLGALLDAADPAAVVTNYLVLSTAAQDTLSTDVPIELLPALVDLAEQVRGQELEVVPLPPAAVTPEAPDYDQIRAAVEQALGPPAPAGSAG